MTQMMPMTMANDARKPAAWLVAGGIVGAITLTVSCLVILSHAV